MDLQQILNDQLARFIDLRLVDMVEVLVEMGANPNIYRRNFYTSGSIKATPLHVAIRNSDIKMVEYLVKCPKVDRSGLDKTIIYSMALKDREILSLLKELDFFEDRGSWIFGVS